MNATHNATRKTKGKIMIYDAKNDEMISMIEYEKRNGKIIIDDATIQSIRRIDEHMHGATGWDAQNAKRKNARREKRQRDILKCDSSTFPERKTK